MLLSSHILAEVQVCTSATIIGNGRLLASGRVADLIGTGSTRTASPVPEPDAAKGVLLARGRLRGRGGSGGVIVDSDRSPAEITRTSPGRDLAVRVTPVRADLETVFLELTAGDTLGREVQR